MNPKPLRQTIRKNRDQLQSYKEELLNIQQNDLGKIISSIKDQAIVLNKQINHGLLQNRNYSYQTLEEIIKEYEEILIFDDEKLKQWQRNRYQQFRNGELFESSNISEILATIEMFSEQDSQWKQHLNPNSSNQNTKIITQYNPQEEIVNTDIYRVSIKQNHFFLNLFGFPIILLNPNIQNGEYMIFVTNNETLESLWCKIVELKILREFFIFYFYNQYQNNSRMFRNTPLIGFANHQLMSINLITSQQAYIPIIEYNLQGDSSNNEKEFTYYYKIQLENNEIKLCGDGISFKEKNKGLVIIQQILAGDMIFTKKSIRKVIPSKPIKAKLLDNCLNQENMKQINSYIFKQEEMKFLDEQMNLSVLVIFSISGKYEFEKNIKFPPNCPMYLLSQYCIKDQPLFNHNYLMWCEFKQNTETIPLQNKAQFPLLEFDLRQIDFQQQSFNIFICNKKTKLLIQKDLPCKIVDNQYEINTKLVFQQLQTDYGLGKLSVIGNITLYNNDLIKTNTFDLYLVYHQNTCNANININFKLNQDIISISLCEDTTIQDIHKIVESLLESKIETKRHIVILNDQLLINLDLNSQIKKYAINKTIDILILKTSAYQALLFVLLLQNDTNYTLQQLFNSLNFILLPGQQSIQVLYNIVNEGNLIQQVQNISNMEAFCLYIYTTNYLHQSLNQQIRDTQFQQQQEKWLIYLNIMLKALKKLPSLRKKLYRGIQSEVDYNKFKIGKLLYFQNFLSTSDQEEIAINFCGQNGTLFEIDSLNGKSISGFSEFPIETEILIAPYSLFVVQSISKQPNYTRIKLKEMACPKSVKMVLWVDSQELNQEQQQFLQSQGYDMLYVNANVADLSENLSLWGSFYKILSNKQIKIVFNFTKDINLALLKCIFNTHKYNKEVYIYTKQQLMIKRYSYLGVYRMIDNISEINSESTINLHKDEVINNILNILQLESTMIDKKYNKQWLPGQKIKNGITYKNRQNWIAIGIQQSKQVDDKYITLYIGVKAEDIKGILKNVNTGLNVNPFPLLLNSIEIFPNQAIYALTDTNSAGQMQIPFQIGDLSVKFVLQIKANQNNLILNFLKQEQGIINKNCQVYKIQNQKEVIIQRLLIQQYSN